MRLFKRKNLPVMGTVPVWKSNPYRQKDQG